MKSSEINFFLFRKPTLSSTFLISLGFKGKVVNRALLSLHGGLLHLSFKNCYFRVFNNKKQFMNDVRDRKLVLELPTLSRAGCIGSVYQDLFSILKLWFSTGDFFKQRNYRLLASNSCFSINHTDVYILIPIVCNMHVVITSDVRCTKM